MLTCTHIAVLGEFPADLHPDVRELVVWEEAVGEGLCSKAISKATSSVVKVLVELLQLV